MRPRVGVQFRESGTELPYRQGNFSAHLDQNAGATFKSERMFSNKIESIARENDVKLETPSQSSGAESPILLFSNSEEGRRAREFRRGSAPNRFDSRSRQSNSESGTPRNTARIPSWADFQKGRIPKKATFCRDRPR